MDKVIEGFLERNLSKFRDRIVANIVGGDRDEYWVTANGGNVYVKGNNYVSAIHGIYVYLKRYCGVQLSWAGNRRIDIDDLVMFEGELHEVIEERFRVYMNYCTLDYSMCWWNFERWEREIDFMAMNGINMPLAVVGTEGAWYKTMLDMGLTKAEALSTVSGPAFWAWHLMTNIEGYLPPSDESYIAERVALGQKIMNRYIEYGMQPIEQGFSGHVPLLLKKKYPKAKIIKKSGWNMFGPTGQLDPLDPLFDRIGKAYLSNVVELFGNYHYFATDPFHEGYPPRRGRRYLESVGKKINNLFKSFDDKSVWVMQGWTPREDIIKAVPRSRLLILDLSSDRSYRFDKFYGYEVVAGMLHDFGGKNAMQGKIRRHADNAYLRLKTDGVNVVGTGMFMEGIEQNPVVYDLQFEMLTKPGKIDFDIWLRDYINRRYGGSNDDIIMAWNILMETCYRDKGYEENEVGSTIAARPQIAVKRAGPCCLVKPWYDTKRLEDALRYFAKASDEFATSDGYQYDLCDIMRQVMSNRFHDNELLYDEAYLARDIDAMQRIAKSQLELLSDMDELLSHRSEMCLSRWICDAQRLATSDSEAKYYELNARTLITCWGDITKDYGMLNDYAWREWSGLISEYYAKRWSMFYDATIDAVSNGHKLKHSKSDTYMSRTRYKKYPFNKRLSEFELKFVHSSRQYEYPIDSDVLPSVKRCMAKYLDDVKS